MSKSVMDTKNHGYKVSPSIAILKKERKGARERWPQRRQIFNLQDHSWQPVTIWIRSSFQRDQRSTKLEKEQTRFTWMSRKDYWYYICTEKNIICRKNGWKGTIPDVTRGSGFNNNKDPKKVLNSETQTTNKNGYTDMPDYTDSAQLLM